MSQKRKAQLCINLHRFSSKWPVYSVWGPRTEYELVFKLDIDFLPLFSPPQIFRWFGEKLQTTAEATEGTTAKSLCSRVIILK